VDARKRRRPPAWGYWRPAAGESDRLRSLSAQAGRVELKVIVAGHCDRLLGIGRNPGQPRRVYFLDTPDLALHRNGLIVRFRERPGRPDDAVVKLRPVTPRSLPGWLRRVGSFDMEVDAMPGRYVCSGALKERLGRRRVTRVVAAGRPLTGLLTSRQRRLFEAYAPAGVKLGDLKTFGPIEVRRGPVTVRGLERELTVERWTYPDGTELLELSTRCPAGRAPAVAARVSAALRDQGVAPADFQPTKSELALTVAARRRPGRAA
jgi:hypothetical protein